MATAPSSINRYFFQDTNTFHEEIVALHDFVLPTATALWTFRKLIEREFEEDPTTTVSALSAKYNNAPGTRESTNLVVPFRNHTWEMQRERLAEVALVNIIALFEMWCDDICEIFGKEKLAAELQYPTNNTVSHGIRFALQELRVNGSVILSNSIQTTLVQGRKYSLASLDNLLRCYRYFKELRNCLMHRGRECDGKLWGAQSAFIPVASAPALGMDFVPEHLIFKRGDQVHLSLHGVLGFTDVILRIATTVNAELVATLAGEQVLIERIKSNTQIPVRPEKIPSLFTTLGWTGATLTPDLLNFLRQSGAVI
jgi:hypothetical protein